MKRAFDDNVSKSKPRLRLGRALAGVSEVEPGAEVPLTPAAPPAAVPNYDDAPFADPAALRASAGWLNEAGGGFGEEPKRASSPAGLIAVALLLMTLVFIAVRLILAKG